MFWLEEKLILMTHMFNWSEVHLSQMTCYKIHTLATCYIDQTHIKNLGHVVPLIRFSLHCTVHIGQELITRSTPFVIHFVMMPNQLSDVGLTGWSIYCKGHLHGIRLTHNNKKNPLYLVIHSAMADIFTLWCFKLGWNNPVFIPITIKIYIQR
jgi:hypothetical protein